MPNCERCGIFLNTNKGICEKCDSELNEERKRLNTDDEIKVANKGKYVCPSCNFRFDKPSSILWPKDVKWYKPQINKLECPHCKIFLKEKRKNAITNISRIIFLTIFL